MKVNYEIRFFGMARCGIHAVSNWVLNHFDKTLYLNNILPRKIYGKIVGWESDTLIKNIHECDRLDCFGLGFEDYDVITMLKLLPENYWIPKTEKSKVVKNVIIARDPYNWLASRLKRNRESDGIPPILKRTIQRYKENVWEGTGKSNEIPNKIFINYNKWFVDAEYRKEISEKLGVKHVDAGKNELARSSSFSGFEHKQDANKLDVLKRYEYYLADAEYRSFFSDSELNKIGEEVFKINPFISIDEPKRKKTRIRC